MFRYWSLMGSITNSDIFHTNRHHLIDMLTKFCQNHISPALLQRPDVRCPYILTKNSHVFMRPVDGFVYLVGMVTEDGHSGVEVRYRI